MRVISGKARGIPLVTAPGLHTRPTTDRIKETLFNMIAFSVADSSFLDLFSGSGAIGIEALSRGAKESVFVEKDKKACDCIKKNLSKTKLQDDAQLMAEDVCTALEQLGRLGRRFHIIFMDPPYQLGCEGKILEAIRRYKVARKDAMIIVEARLETDFSFVEQCGYAVVREKCYKTNKHVFLQQQEIE